MQKDIHPQYHKNATFTCVCGKTHKIGSTSEKMGVEICGNCHPFYTGSQQLIDSTGRVERFKSRSSKIKPKKERKPRVKKK